MLVCKHSHAPGDSLVPSKSTLSVNTPHCDIYVTKTQATLVSRTGLKFVHEKSSLGEKVMDFGYDVFCNHFLYFSSP